MSWFRKALYIGSGHFFARGYVEVHNNYTVSGILLLLSLLCYGLAEYLDKSR